MVPKPKFTPFITEGMGLAERVGEVVRAAKAKEFVPDPRPASLARIQSDLAFLKRNPGAESRPAPTARNMTSAQKGAIDARKGKKKNDRSWPVAPWGSLPSHGKKSGPKGGR